MALLVVSSIGSVLLLRAVLFDRLEDEVQATLEREAEEFELLSAGNDPETGAPFDGDLRAIFDSYFAREIADEGETLLAFIDGELYQSRRAQDAAEAEEIQPAVDFWLTLDRRQRGVIDTTLGRARYVALPIDSGRGDGLFVVVNFPQFERREIDDAVRTNIVIQLITMVVVAGLGLFLAGRVLRPMSSLARTASTISDTNMTQRIPVTGSDEASQIAVAFNEMLSRLEAAFATQQRFLHDTSHELRTPLTVIRGHVEILEVDATAQDRAATVALVTDEIDRMSRIVNDLFLLAMAERPDFLRTELVDLREIVIETSQKVAALGARDWAVDARHPVLVIGDRQRLTQAIVALVANAVSATDETDSICIGVTETTGVATIWVEDTGQGLAPDDAERVFERFARGPVPEASAADDNEGGGDARAAGAGIGLAIVRAIAEAHGGRARATSQPGSGTRFEIVIPSAPRC